MSDDNSTVIHIPVSATEDETSIFNLEEVITGVLGNDPDELDDLFEEGTFAKILVEAENGVVSIGDGQAIYTPNPDYFGPDMFTVVIAEEQDELDDFTINPDGTFEDDDDLGVFKFQIEVASVNDPPVAVDDPPFFVEFGDMALVDVAANDTDIDGTVDPTTLTFFDADLGIAVENAGLLKYTADTIVYDTIDSSANDPLTYTIDDNEGLTSNPANITAKIIDPLRETSTDSANASNNQLITLSLSTEDRTFNTSSFVDADIIVGSLDQPDINVSFVIDESGSISNNQFIQEQQAVQNTINLLRNDFQGTGTDVEVQIVEFAGGASSQTFDLFDTALDDVTTGTPIATQSGGLTNYEAALQQTVNFFTNQGGDANFLLFTSDGQPTAGGSFTDEVDSLTGLNVSRTAVGFGSANTATLDQIDNTGGSQVLNSAADLGDAFAASPLFPADLITFSLTVDGSLVANQDDLTPLGGGDFSLNSTLTGLSNGIGTTNTVVAEASFDIDNDGTVDEFRTATTVIDGTDGSDIF